MFADVTRRLSRMDGWMRSKARHPYVLLLIGFAVLFDGTESVYLALDDGGVGWLIGVVSLVQVALAIGMYWQPVPCGAGCILFGVLLGMVPSVVFPSWLWGIWLAFAMLGYWRKFGWGIALFIIRMIVSIYVLMALRNETWSGLGIISYAGTICFAFVFGYAISEHQMVEQARGELWEMKIKARDKERLERNIRIASRLHDSTTRYLAEISLIVERLRHEGAREYMRDLELMQDCSCKALAGIREAIDVLDGNHEDGDGDVWPQVLGRMVREEAERERDALSIRGIVGDVRIDDDFQWSMDVVSDAVRSELFGLIDQVFANIGLYASKGDASYYFYTSIGECKIIVNQSNFINDDDAIQNEITGVRRGLALHKKRIESLGGTLETKIEDAEWNLHAVIPLR